MLTRFHSNLICLCKTFFSILMAFLLKFVQTSSRSRANTGYASGMDGRMDGRTGIPSHRDSLVHLMRCVDA